VSLSKPIAITLLAGLGLAGCGFQLQGRQPLPPDLQRVCLVASDRQSDFVDALRRNLRTSGATIVTDEMAATAVLRIDKDELTQKVLAVSSSNLPREYELTYRISARADAGERVLLERQDLELSRNFTFDERQVLAKEHEREQLRGELARELAATLLRRLRAR
jgi:LPS-assembly lipoprotein